MLSPWIQQSLKSSSNSGILGTQIRKFSELVFVTYPIKISQSLLGGIIIVSDEETQLMCKNIIKFSQLLSNQWPSQNLNTLF